MHIMIGFLYNIYSKIV